MGRLATRLLKLPPTHRRTPSFLLHHRDASRHWADQRTQVAADALVVNDVRYVLRWCARAQICRRPWRDRDALMRAILARDIAQVAADTFLVIDLGDDLVIQVQVAPIHDARQRS